MVQMNSVVQRAVVTCVITAVVAACGGFQCSDR